MCCCLKSQSKRHLKTVLWRNKLMIKRSKKALCCFFAGPLFFFGLSMILVRNFAGTTQSITTMEPYVVSSSSFSEDGA